MHNLSWQPPAFPGWMAIFIPFTTKELYSNGQYYGMNSLSNNVILVNRKDLVN